MKIVSEFDVLLMSQISVVDIVMRLRAGGSGENSGGFKEFSSKLSKPPLDPSSLLFIGCRDAFFWGKGAGVLC